MRKNKSYTICANFSQCKNCIDVTDVIPIQIATYKTQPIHEVKLCEECSTKKFEEKRKENPTLFKEK